MRTVGVVVLLALATGLALHVEPRSQPLSRQLTQCFDVLTRLKVRTTMLAALDAALQESIAKTFSVWMSDSKDQPARAHKGMQNAISAYLYARDEVFAWNPPLCEPPQEQKQ
jgi:hypothetical protein